MDVTIKDIAKECGVSVSSVSRALNNHPDINPKTKARIMKVIRERGFVPNNSARNMRRSETNNIALLVKGITNLFFTEMIRFMVSELEKNGYTTILQHVVTDEDEVSVAQSLVIEKKLKGIIFLGGNFDHGESALKQLGVPIVFSTVGADRLDTGNVRCAHVCINDVESGWLATDYLLGLGHRRIAIITEGLQVPSVGRMRTLGYRRALEEHGIPYRPELVFEVKDGAEHYTLPNGYKAASELLDSGEKVDAIFCISDVLAIGACRAIQDRGLKIPEDVSVLGFDGIEMGSYVNPRLSTVSQPIREIAETSIRLLFDMLDGGSGENCTLDAKIVQRESTGRRDA
ncbi:MAG: LacI family DNA-binding transcriptional regulator [Chordicoccus sp.]